MTFEYWGLVAVLSRSLCTVVTAECIPGPGQWYSLWCKPVSEDSLMSRMCGTRLRSYYIYMCMRVLFPLFNVRYLLHTIAPIHKKRFVITLIFFKWNHTYLFSSPVIPWSSQPAAEIFSPVSSGWVPVFSHFPWSEHICRSTVISALPKFLHSTVHAELSVQCGQAGTVSNFNAKET